MDDLVWMGAQPCQAARLCPGDQVARIYPVAHFYRVFRLYLYQDVMLDHDVLAAQVVAAYEIRSQHRSEFAVLLFLAAARQHLYFR